MKNKNYLLYLVGIIITLIVFYFQLDLKLLYFNQQPLFSLDSQSFLSSFTTPGGFVDYLSNFFTALYAFELIGIFSLIFIIAIILFVVNNRFKTGQHNIKLFILPVVWFLTVLLLFDYDFQINNLIILIASYVLSFIWFRSFSLSKNLFVIIGSIILGVFIYVIVGGLGLALTTIFTITLILFSNLIINKKLLSIAIVLLCQLFIPFIMVKLFFNLLPLKIAYISDYSLSVMWFILAFVLIAINYCFFKFTNPNQPNGKTKQIVFYVTSIIVLIVPYQTLNKSEKNVIKLNYYANIQSWDEVIELIKTEKMYDQNSIFLYNRALLNKGLLLENCFDIPQSFGIAGLFFDPLSDESKLMMACDLYFDLGLINEAKHWGHEAFTVFHEQPRVLKRLVEANIINGQYKTALKYIIMLKTSLVDRKWALEYEDLINGKKSLDSFPELLQKQSVLPTQDFFADPKNQEENLINLLNQPNPNPLAFDYLMAYYLMNHKMGYILKNISTFRKYKYSYLPKHIQEALTVYLMQTKDFSIDMQGYQLANDYVPKLKSYVKYHNSAQKGNAKAKLELDRNYSNTYWYYMQVVSPLANK